MLLREKWKIGRTGDIWFVHGPLIHQYYRILPVFGGMGVTDTGLFIRGKRVGFRAERWDQDRNHWRLMNTSTTWNGALKVIAFREDQLATHHHSLHHLEPCS